MELKTPNDEKTSLIKEDEDIKEERCSSCLRFPKAVYFIISLELCERFNYYGMRTILILYLTQYVQLRDDNAISIYHIFISLCYITTIFGSFLADNYLGRYKTLLIISFVYIVGSSLMSLTSIPAKNLSGPLISLVLIAFGTGGVKSCVGPFGGDQIPTEKKVLLDSFFSMFYFAINLGAFLSTIITPILRANVACNGSNDCYPLAFGVPAILMGVALIILLAGRPFYIDATVKDNIYIRSIKCIIFSIKTWCRERRTNPRKNLLDYASKEYDAQFINDLRTLYSIAILYIPLPIYWSLYDQMGSRWTLQAAQLDGEIGSRFIMLPDQMSLFNVILIMALIPVFDGCIYPLSYRINPILRPLRRITTGIAITALSFLVAFILQSQIEQKLPTVIAPATSRLVLVSGLSCDVNVYVPDGRLLSATSYRTSSSYLDLVAGNQQVQFKFIKCSGIDIPSPVINTILLFPNQVNFLVTEMDNANKVIIRNINDYRASDIKGHPLIRLAASTTFFNAYQFRLKYAVNGMVINSFTVGNNQSLYVSSWVTLMNPGRYLWNVKVPPGSYKNSTTKWLGVLTFNGGGTLQVTPIKITSSEVVIFYMTMNDKSAVGIPLLINNGAQISILWQIPQYVLISIGEILVSISGLSFSYDQAPDGMKSLVNALWFFTVAIGNILVMVVVKIHLVGKQSWEYLIFAIICAVSTVIFAILAYFYRMRMKPESEIIVDGMQLDTKD